MINRNPPQFDTGRVPLSVGRGGDADSKSRVRHHITTACVRVNYKDRP